MYFERVTVTPDKARAWLRLNADNQRNEKRSKIPMYARDMASGRWNSDTGETLKFNKAGRLIDGQNRLQAVILANVPVDFDVARDVPEEAMLVIDSGASRNAADALKIAGATSRFTAGAIVRWVICWDAGNYTAMRGNQIAPTVSEIWDRYCVEPAVFDAASARASDCRGRGIGTASPLGTGFYLMYRIDSDEAHAFFDHLISGANLAEGHPVLTLRNRLIRSKVARLKAEEQLALVIRAWNAFRAGETLHRILVSRDPLSNKNFPQPK